MRTTLEKEHVMNGNQAVRAFDDAVESELHPDGVPLIVRPLSSDLAQSPEAAVGWFQANLPAIEDALSTTGALMFRGFAIQSSADFANFVAPIPTVSFDYAGGGTPRDAVASNVYESTRLPPIQTLPLHQEMSNLPNFPGRVAFYCQTPSEQGGETTIGDIRRIQAEIPKPIVDRMKDVGIRYMRNFRSPENTTGVPRLDQRHKTWVEGFMTDDPAIVEQRCKEMGLELEWLDDGSAHTHFTAPGFARHPVTDEEVWFSLMGVASYDGDTELQELIEKYYPPGKVRHADFSWGDGRPIDPEDRVAMESAYVANTVAEPWQMSDVMILDNYYVCHGRNPYSGERDIQVMLLQPEGHQ
jgi:hypothetical protein